MSAPASGPAAGEGEMGVPPSSGCPAILAPADFDLRNAPVAGDGVLVREDVWLLPGSCGLHDSSGTPIEESVLRRGPDLGTYPHGRLEAFDPEAVGGGVTTLERAVWVAYASMRHFGHLLTEFAGNVGPLVACRDGVDGIGGPGAVLAVPARAAGSRIGLAALLGLPPERVLCSASLERPLRIRRAFIPRPSMRNRHGVASVHFEHVRLVLSRLHGVDDAIASMSLPDADEKLYLTRSRLPEGARRVEDEEDLERRLSAAGWRVAAPESLPLGDQLRLLASARVIAGSLGSALHLPMAFGASFGRRRLVSLGLPAAACNPNVVLQATCQGMPMRHVVCHERDPGSPRLLRFTVPPQRVAEALERLAGPGWP